LCFELKKSFVFRFFIQHSTFFHLSPAVKKKNKKTVKHIFGVFSGRHGYQVTNVGGVKSNIVMFVTSLQNKQTSM